MGGPCCRAAKVVIAAGQAGGGEPIAGSRKPEGPALIWCPFASEQDAARAAEMLLDEKLIACANILPQMRSLYIWNGERGEGEEAGVLFKTDAALLDAAIARLAEIHPYDEPAAIGWRAEAAPPGARNWLAGLVEAVPA